MRLCSRNDAHLPNFFSISIASHDSINDRRLASFRVGIFFANSVNFDILGIVHIDELFIYIRAIGPRMHQTTVRFTTLISDLKRNSYRH